MSVLIRNALLSKNMKNSLQRFSSRSCSKSNIDLSSNVFGGKSFLVVACSVVGAVLLEINNKKH